MGFKSSADYFNYKTAFYPINFQKDQGAITGNLIFNGYVYYRAFVEFANSPNLKLEYSCLPGEKYRTDIILSSIEKSEIGERNFLECEVAFTALSFWYREVVEISTEIIEDSIKTYNYTYPFSYHSFTKDKIVLNNEGQFETPLVLEFFGNTTSPSYYLMHNDKIVGNGQIGVTVEIGQKLLIDSNIITSRIELQDSNGKYIENVYGLSDFSTTRFLNLPLGESILHIGSESLEIPLIKVSYRSYYATV